MENAFKPLVRLLSSVVDAFTAAFFLADGKGRELRCVAVQSLSAQVPEDLVIPLGQAGILGQVHRMGQPVEMSGAGSGAASLTVPLYREGEPPIKALLAVPVAGGAGVLYVDTRQAWGFNDTQRRSIEETAGVLQALLRVEAWDRVQEGAARTLDLCRRVDEAASSTGDPHEFRRIVLLECARLLRVETAFFAAREPRSDHFRIAEVAPPVTQERLTEAFSLSRGLVGWVFRNCKPLLVPRLNPDAPDHVLLVPGEDLPHSGSFFAVPAQGSLGHTLVAAFVSRSPVAWTAPEREAVGRAVRMTQLVADRAHWREEFERWRAHDPATGFLHARAFEEAVEAALARCIGRSAPCVLAVVQVEPWQMLWAVKRPKDVRALHLEIAGDMGALVPPGTLIGRLTENRFGFFFEERADEGAEWLLSRLPGFDRKAALEGGRFVKLRAHAGLAACPRDATRAEDLWPIAHRRLFSVPKSQG